MANYTKRSVDIIWRLCKINQENKLEKCARIKKIRRTCRCARMKVHVHTHRHETTPKCKKKINVKIKYNQGNRKILLKWMETKLNQRRQLFCVWMGKFIFFEILLFSKFIYVFNSVSLNLSKLSLILLEYLEGETRKNSF